VLQNPPAVMTTSALPVFLFIVIATILAASILVAAQTLGPRRRRTDVKSMPYESGMDPIHDARQRFNIGFYLLAIEFLVFDVEILILLPWAVAAGGKQTGTLGAGHGVFWVVMIFLVILTVGFIYTWRKGVFKWK
jgi:NADH-quinone oxidoreductase subunit A